MCDARAKLLFCLLKVFFSVLLLLLLLVVVFFFLHSRCRSVVESNAAAKQEEVTAFNVGFDAHWKSKRLLTEVFLPSKRGVQPEKTTDRRETKCQLAKYRNKTKELYNTLVIFKMIFSVC